MTAVKTKILVSEGSEILRKGLIALLNNTEFEIAAEAANGKELIEQLKSTYIDIVLLGTNTSVIEGRPVLEIIHKRFPEVKVIALGNEEEIHLKSDFMINGANAFLSKNCELKILFRALRKVKTEGYFFDSSTSIALLDKVLKDKQRSSDTSLTALNDRETSVLKQICDGKTNKEIALSLHLSPSTIDFYRTRIYGKTKCNNATRLLKYALKNGIVALS